MVGGGDMAGDIVFIGSQSIGHGCLNEILNMGMTPSAVFTFKPDPHEKWKNSVDTIAKERSIPLFYPEDLTVDKIAELAPDLILGVGYRKLFPKGILDLPRCGVFGLHASLLPHLRGQAPLNWSVINGDSRTGITMFRLDGGIDTGDIAGQKETPIGENDTITEIKHRVEGLAVELVRENVRPILEGRAVLRRQAGDGTYGCARTPEDGRIDWHDSTRKIFNLVRGSEPDYAAYAFLGPEKLSILKCIIPPGGGTYYGTPGQVAMTHKDGSVSVKTGDGIIRVTRIGVGGQEQTFVKKYLKSSKMRLR